MLSLLSLALLSLTTSAAPKVEVRPAPIFLVLKTAVSPTAAKREAKLHDEVALLLDNFAVLSQSIDDPGFEKRALPEQLKRVLEVATHNEAIGVLWLAEPTKGQLMVYVVGMGTGRALIRTLEFDQKSSSEKGLALIVRELLGTAFLQAAPEAIDPGLAEVVRGVRKALPKDPALEPKASEAPKPLSVAELLPVSEKAVSVSVLLTSALGLTGSLDSRLVSVGAQVRVERAFGPRFNLGLEAEVRGGRDFSPLSAVATLEVPVGVTASANLVAFGFLLMPRLSLLPGFTRLWARTYVGSNLGNVFSLRARAALGVSPLPNKNAPVQPLLELSVDALPIRAGVRDATTAADAWRAPWLELRFTAGFCWKG